MINKFTFFQYETIYTCHLNKIESSVNNSFLPLSKPSISEHEIAAVALCCGRTSSAEIRISLSAAPTCLVQLQVNTWCSYVSEKSGALAQKYRQGTCLQWMKAE